MRSSFKHIPLNLLCNVRKTILLKFLTQRLNQTMRLIRGKHRVKVTCFGNHHILRLARSVALNGNSQAICPLFQADVSDSAHLEPVYLRMSGRFLQDQKWSTSTVQL